MWGAASGVWAPARGRAIHTLPAPSLAEVGTLCLPTLHTDLARLANEHGPVFRIPFGDCPAVVVGDPDLAEHVLSPRRAGRAFSRRWEDTRFFPFAEFGRILGASASASETAGIFFGNGPRHWAPARRAAERGLLQGRAVREAGEAFAAGAAARLAERWAARGGGLFEVQGDLREAALEVVLAVAFGGAGPGAGRALGAELRDIYGGVTRAFEDLLGVPPSTWWLLRRRRARELDAAAGRLNRLLAPALRRRREAPAGTAARCLLDLLVDDGMPDGAVLLNALQILGAGHDTTATSLAMLLWQLSGDAPLQDAVRRELRAPGEHPLLSACVRETLRLWPAAPLVVRQACEQAPPWRGLRIPVGTVAIVCPWLLGHSSEMWKDPHLFRPQRFLEDPAGGGAGHRFSFVPFGYGLRSCVGQHLAMAELRLFASALLPRFVFSAAEPPIVEWFLTLRLKQGLQLHLQEV